jgi:hypothetical protein
LPLLVARIGRADEAHDAVAANDLALAADFLDGGQNFHFFLKSGTRDEHAWVALLRHPDAPSAIARRYRFRFESFRTEAKALSSLGPLPLSAPYLARNVILALDKSYGVNSTVTLSPGRILM